MKHCNRCQQDKPLDAFNKDSSSKDSHFSWCKICSREVDKEKYLRKKLGICKGRKQKQERLPTPEKKTCSFCGEEKDSAFFGKAKGNLDGLKTECKTCTPKKYPHLYDGKRYKGKYKEYSRQNYLKHRDDKIQYTKTWRKNNKERVRENSKRFKRKPIERIKRGLRKRIKELLKDASTKNDCSIGCSKQELLIYLESKFQSGMSWENYGSGENKWHVDHIKPLNLFDLSKKEERCKANHFANLQPLWSHQNEAKSDNYDPDHPMGWHGLDALMNQETAKKSGDSQL